MKITFLGTGAGSSTLRAHTGMALECPDGTKLLLDSSSGNSALRHAATVGLNLREFDDVLLSHDHPDHMSGIDFIEFNRDSGERRLSTSTRPCQLRGFGGVEAALHHDPIEHQGYFR